ncbi:MULTISPECIES: amylo-alpha-1,6-glucosidase [unclassified Coleofasciculus]|uniref:amylo-alpha-1,6-glucosidase n=1 Tax=unclassified Coleofasciculus TaxID=2692782 RepID=UPI0018801047|nr:MULTISPECIES: amylo-alpha-1,6-glucosidase [unclassified Coleofasciculus]MBE9129064.1 glycogen debranching enzyme family protein [Coleofasciculus sp. LEGE 07081]MBE9152129.1 glycogen debranching enzyme family protein [Coleofasciculus sp. LEGE 07092]
MSYLDRREWLLTNGLGSFASGTVCDARTRTYHGWLIAALEPPGRRTLLLSHIDASLEVAGKVWAISTNFWDGGRKIDPLGYQLLRWFDTEPVPKWIWGAQEWQLTRRLVMPYGLVESGEDPTAEFQCCNRILIEYHYQGSEIATLRLRPLIADRDFHHQQLADDSLQFSQLVGHQQIYLQAIRDNQPGTPWQLRWSGGDYQPEGVWYWNYYYPEEKQRGLGDREDLYSPGYLTVIMHPGATVTLEARVGCLEVAPTQEATHSISTEVFEQAVQDEKERHNRLYERFLVAPNRLPEPPISPLPIPEKIWRQLLRAGDQFIAYRASIQGPTVIAGYPWFDDWGRDTLIALPGLALATKRFSLAKGLLKTFGRYCRDGLIPNTFPDGSTEPIYNSIDASLWWLETLGLYLEMTQDWDFLIQQYPVVRKIYKTYTAGTHYHIQVDATDGLLTWDAPNMAITWMDVVLDGNPITPRLGKVIEINALWYSALCWIAKWTEKMVIGSIKDRVRLLHHAQHYTQQAQKVKISLQKFWNPEQNYFYDVIEPDDHRDERIRPNAVLALSLYHCGFPEEQARQVLQVARDRLLTPYGLRSLDPNHPEYIGYYSGDRWHRDSAYHQGTVWSWLLGPFSRAWTRFYPKEPLPFDWQPLLNHLQEQACIGSISEIFDGDAPHLPQGTIAQAWSVAELIRYFAD